MQEAQRQDLGREKTRPGPANELVEAAPLAGETSRNRTHPQTESVGGEADVVGQSGQVVGEEL